MKLEERDELYVQWVVETRMNAFMLAGKPASRDCVEMRTFREVSTAIEDGRWPGLLLDPKADLEADE